MTEPRTLTIRDKELDSLFQKVLPPEDFGEDSNVEELYNRIIDLEVKAIAPKTLTEAVNLGKGYGIDTAETILISAIAKVMEAYRGERLAFDAVSDVKRLFREECIRYKSQLTKPVTEEEKRKLLNKQ